MLQVCDLPVFLGHDVSCLAKPHQSALQPLNAEADYADKITKQKNEISKFRIF
mgnify:CR=1 FL=1